MVRVSVVNALKNIVQKEEGHKDRYKERVKI
jgi:hypothetical protein